MPATLAMNDHKTDTSILKAPKDHHQTGMVTGRPSTREAVEERPPVQSAGSITQPSGSNEQANRGVAERTGMDLVRKQV